MVNQIFDYIGLKLKIANPWIDTYAVNCVEMPIKNGTVIQKRVVNLEGFEKEDFSVSDIKGSGFYIKLDPIFEYSTGRQLTSSQKEFSVTVKFRLLFFSINSDVERRKIVIENIFVNNLRQLSWLEYAGSEKSIVLQLTKTSTNAEVIFKEETGVDLNKGAEAFFVAFDGKITFISTNDNCESECGISTSESILGGLNFCDENIINLLSEEQKNCLIQFLCEMPTKFKKLTFTGSINGSNTIFVASDEIVQLFKNGQLLLLDADYTLSLDKKTATLLVAPDATFGDALTFFGNI